MLALLLLTFSHVPTYGNGADGCTSLPHHHTTSQVSYKTGSAGIEIHIESLTQPFDILGGELMDIDVVFRNNYDQSTYSLYIGCGGCVANVDPIVIPPLVLDGYRPGEVEPFTQVRARHQTLVCVLATKCARVLLADGVPFGLS